MRIFSVLTCTAALATMLTSPAQAQTLDPDVPEDALAIMKRAQCGVADQQPAVYHWAGKVYSRVQGEPDRHLFNVEGMNVRQCTSVEDAERGTGYRQVSREIMLYLDPETGEVVREWENPWSGETVEVIHVANDPVNMRAPAFPRGADGSPYTISYNRDGSWLTMPVVVPLFYENPLGGDYQDYVGGKYHAMEIFTFVLDEDDLDPTNPTAYPAVAWTRLSDWMPWMKMRGRQGQLVHHAAGAKLESYDELPDVLKREIAANYPEYTAPPPVDDTRPNETSWTVFRQTIDDQRGD